MAFISFSETMLLVYLSYKVIHYDKVSLHDVVTGTEVDVVWQGTEVWKGRGCLGEVQGRYWSGSRTLPFISAGTRGVTRPRALLKVRLLPWSGNSSPAPVRQARECRAVGLRVGRDQRRGNKRLYDGSSAASSLLLHPHSLLKDCFYFIL